MEDDGQVFMDLPDKGAREATDEERERYLQAMRAEAEAVRAQLERMAKANE